jgi:type I restriction enzyme S subunit
LTYSIHGNANKLLRLVTSAGNTAGVLDTAVLKSFRIWLPDRSEQERVVSVLDDVTQEIEELELYLVKAKSIKKGMMQQLLTGRTRLPVKEVTA